MSKKIITTSVNAEKHREIQKMGLAISDILDEAFDNKLKGIVVLDTTLLYKMRGERRRLMDQVADLTVKEQTIFRKKERIQMEIDALTKEIGIIQRDAEDAAQSDEATEILREVNAAIIDSDYDIVNVQAQVPDLLATLQRLMPQFDLEKQIEVMKSFSD